MASFSVPCPKSSAFPQCITSRSSLQQHGPHQHHHSNNISFLLGLNSSPSSVISPSSLHHPTTTFQFQLPNQKQATLWKLHVQLKEVVAEKSSNSAPVPETSLGGELAEEKDESSKEVSGQNTIPDVSSISAFMMNVSDLVKLVDSRDIMELQLKQLDCELIIRKKEALQQPPPAAPVITMQSPMPQSILPFQLPLAQSPAPAPATPVTSAPAPALPPPAKTSKSSHPPLNCPMAGTFYRCPAPGEPPFVKVGDKVQKGQVICIIEAMKLMNEIEADQSGTIVEVLVEDGKPVGMDTPLLVIVP